MTSSPDRMRGPAIDPLPPSFSSMWRLCKLGYRQEPRLMFVAFVLSQLAAVPDALLALWLMLLGRGVVEHRPVLVEIAAAGLAISTAATWLLRVVSTRVTRRFRDKVTISLEAHIAQLQATIGTIAHQERPEYIDRLSMLRDQVFMLDHMYMSVFSTLGWVLRLGITVALLASVHPALMLLAVFGIPAALTSTWRPAVERAAQERGTPFTRLARHLFTVATTAGPAKDVRITGIGAQIAYDRRRAWEQWYALVAPARFRSAGWHTFAWALFGLAYAGAIVFVSSGMHAPAGSVLLVLAAGARLSAYIAATVGEVGFLRMWAEGAQRLAWLEDYAAAVASTSDRSPPSRVREGIRLEHVSFAYPGTTRLVLDDVSVELPAGSVVAIVGENGAGKTTLIKLLSKMYEPSWGAILIDGEPLARMPADAWREKLAGAFQDFVRFELRAQQTVGLGDVPRVDDEPAVVAAVDRAGANDVLTKLPSRLETQLGPTWPGGVDLSFGQWQKLALARGFMRSEPLLLILDEPTAALDAETEHALFEQYAAAAHDVSNETGRITILVSHRFSTVRMADLIVVLDGARLVEVGTHEALMARGGQYAELYGIQATAYR